MKTVIDNKLYDSEKARLIGETARNTSSDTLYLYEQLYKKRTGEYFVYGEGGPDTPYGIEEDDGTMSPGEGITPLTYDEARKWAEASLDGKDYSREFGTIDLSDGAMTTMAVRVSMVGKEALDRRCSRTGKTRSEIVDEFLRSLIEAGDVRQGDTAEADADAGNADATESDAGADANGGSIAMSNKGGKVPEQPASNAAANANAAMGSMNQTAVTNG